jgi:hypothetical protein
MFIAPGSEKIRERAEIEALIPGYLTFFVGAVPPSDGCSFPESPVNLIVTVLN